MLEVKQLSRKYGSFLAVDQVSFNIEKGEIVGLLGHNGAGKTTIMKMISGFLEANTGSVHVDGIDLESEPKRVQKELGYLPESLPVYPDMTVADYLDFAADLKGLQGTEKYVEIRRVVKATDISSKLLAPITTLSRGYKQRVGVAQAILGQPKLLILDEPTNGLDPEQTQHMRRLIMELAKEATVILSTHIMQEVEAICSRVLMLNAGALVLDEQLDALRHSNHLLVETTLANKKLFEDIDGVQSVESLPDVEYGKSFRITARKDIQINLLSAAIAKCIADNGESLFLLNPELRNLETLFNEVSTGSLTKEGVEDAA